MKQKTTTYTHCQCASKDSQLCCPADGELRENWLSTLEEEHEPLRQASKDIANNLKLLYCINYTTNLNAINSCTQIDSPDKA